MTKKDFYNLIEEFVKAGYSEDSVIKLKWTSEPSKDWERCGIPARDCDEIEIRWSRYEWGADGVTMPDGSIKWGKTGYNTEIIFKDYGTWYCDDPRRYEVSGTMFKGLPPVEEVHYNYTTAEEVLEGFEEDYGQAYRYWEVEE